MRPRQFAQITQNVIREHGFAEFLPTACLPARREIRALANVPRDIEVEEASLQWANSLVAPGAEFLVAFKVSSTEFKVVRCAAGETESEVFAVE